jgi:hypothetical protein
MGENGNLELKNKYLLSKWPYKLLNKEGVWQELLHNKYLHSKTPSQVSTKPTESPFRKGLINFNDDFFWEDPLKSVRGEN